MTIIIPCRDEGKCVEECFDSIVANDYVKNRLRYVDGMSEDGR